MKIYIFKKHLLVLFQMYIFNLISHNLKKTETNIIIFFNLVYIQFLSYHSMWSSYGKCPSVNNHKVHST